MASIEGTMDKSDTAFPAVDAKGEINPGVPENFPVDPIASDDAAAKEHKTETETETETEAREGGKAEAEGGKGEVGGTLTSALVISGVVVAAVGVAFFVAKKLKET